MRGLRVYLKTPTTPTEPGTGVNNALAIAESELGLPTGSLLSEVTYFGLGTTVATNALIERKGVKTGLFTTTRGFQDTILHQRGMGHWAGRQLQEVMHYSERRQPEPITPGAL